MSKLKLLALILVLFILISTSSAWRRRRRRRRDPCANQRHSCTWKWGSCSRTCGGGTQRPIVTKRQGTCGTCSLPNSRYCCLRTYCPVNCKWASWGGWESCSASCGGGSQTRRRSILVQNKYGGSSCYGSSTEIRRCNAQCCPTDCKFGPWSVFCKCSKTCGSGVQTRHRKVAVKETCGGKCVGDLHETKTCNSGGCPVDCKWGSWGPFSKCSATCGGGKETRHRKILTNPSYGGRQCTGSSVDTKPCSTHCCPVHCEWGQWNDSKQCSVTCGGGKRIRYRNKAKFAACGGAKCVGECFQLFPCNTDKCPEKY